MGRRNTLPDIEGKPVKLRITRAIWTDYDYDQGGAYWGHTTGTHIYCGHNRAGVRIYTRATGPVEAAAAILAECPPDSTCGGRVMVNGYAASVAVRRSQSEMCDYRLKHLSARP